ncbi:hypothetical protein BSKO_02081 [Bryopsis sp. KO-2023]|nr:hypothetical protein BSKO_02081 [Bryopsis sp. KO-2023]
MGDPWPDYEILRNLGKGGSGIVDEVMLAGKARRKLALKTVSWDGKGNIDVMKSRALKEMAILKKLRHPCLPKLYGFKTTPNDAQILMTQGECGDLQQLQGVDGGLGLDEMQIKLCTAEVLLALEALHANGIVYADMKPENVLMRPCGHVMLCDFDMSLLKSDLEKIRMSKELSVQAETRCVGTLEFCAPEVITGGMLGYSEASDFWGLGVLVYELASGRNPFSGHSAEQTINKILSFTPRLGESIDCSRDMASFVNGLLRHNPEHRLGALGVDAIKGHAWFSDFDWDRHLRELMKCDMAD